MKVRLTGTTSSELDERGASHASTVILCLIQNIKKHQASRKNDNKKKTQPHQECHFNKSASASSQLWMFASRDLQWWGVRRHQWNRLGLCLYFGPTLRLRNHEVESLSRNHRHNISTCGVPCELHISIVRRLKLSKLLIVICSCHLFSARSSCVRFQLNRTLH